MKRKFLALAGIVSLFAACSSDDGSSIDYDQLTKKWYFVSEKANGETFPYDDHETCGKDYLEFFEDGTYTFVDVWDCDAGTPVTDVSGGVYDREGNTITLDGGEPVTVKKLTSSSFVVNTVYDYDDDGDEETVVTTFTNNP